MFLADMETQTPLPTAAERYATIRGRMCARLEAEGARYSIARMVDLLLLELLTYMIGWAIRRAEWRAEQEACRDDSGEELVPGGAFAATVVEGGDASAPRAGGRAVAAAAVAATGGTPVIEATAREDCIGDEGGVRTAAPGRDDTDRVWFGRATKGFCGVIRKIGVFESGRIASKSLLFSNAG
jgi:hypothetical protein